MKSEGRQKVYIMSAGDYVKIGIAAEPGRRVKAIQTGCPIPVKLVATVDADLPLETEALVHDELKNYRVCGEWFKIEASLAVKVVEKISGLVASTWRGQRLATQQLNKYKRFQERRLRRAKRLMPLPEKQFTMGDGRRNAPMGCKLQSIAEIPHVSHGEPGKLRAIFEEVCRSDGKAAAEV